MTPTLIIVDDVSPCAQQIRGAALVHRFGEATVDGVKFNGVLFNKELDDVVRDDICRQISLVVGAPISPVASFFRLYNDQFQPSSYIHSDADHTVQWAAVYHLSRQEDCVGGTAFWKHKETGMDRLPEELRPLRSSFFDQGLDESKWDMIGLAGARFNRLVIYPSQCFHSQYPRSFGGSDSTNGRLTWVCFFHVCKPEEQTEPQFKPRPQRRTFFPQ